MTREGAEYQVDHHSLPRVGEEAFAQDRAILLYSPPIDRNHPLLSPTTVAPAAVTLNHDADDRAEPAVASPPNSATPLVSRERHETVSPAPAPADGSAADDNGEAIAFFARWSSPALAEKALQALHAARDSWDVAEHRMRAESNRLPPLSRQAQHQRSLAFAHAIIRHRKDFAQARRTLADAGYQLSLGDVLHYFYGVFYGSDAHHRLKACVKEAKAAKEISMQSAGVAGERAGSGPADEGEDDGLPDTCTVCGQPGLLLVCDGGCDRVFHPECVGLTGVPEGDWSCDSCSGRRPSPMLMRPGAHASSSPQTSKSACAHSPKSSLPAVSVDGAEISALMSASAATADLRSSGGSEMGWRRLDSILDLPPGWNVGATHDNEPLYIGPHGERAQTYTDVMRFVSASPGGGGGAAGANVVPGAGAALAGAVPVGGNGAGKRRLDHSEANQHLPPARRAPRVYHTSDGRSYTTSGWVA